MNELSRVVLAIIAKVVLFILSLAFVFCVGHFTTIWVLDTTHDAIWEKYVFLWNWLSFGKIVFFGLWGVLLFVFSIRASR